MTEDAKKTIFSPCNHVLETDTAEKKTKPAFYKKINNFAMLVIIFIYSYLFIMAHSTIQYIKTMAGRYWIEKV